MIESLVPHHLVFSAKVRSLSEAEIASLKSNQFLVCKVNNETSVNGPILAIVSCVQDETDLREVQNLTEKFPEARILVQDNIKNPETLRAVIHQWQQVQFFKENFSVDQLTDQLKVIQDLCDHESKKNELRKLASQKYKNLSELNENLEKLVDENTFDLKQSHTEEKSKLKQERELAQFILEMQRTIDPEEAFAQVRKKLKAQKKVFEVLFFQKRSQSILYFQQGRIQSQKINVETIPQSGASWLSFKYQMDLARLISRPLNRILRIPISENADSIEVWLEVLGSDSEIQEFTEPATGILKITRMVIDRILSDESLARESRRWFEIFEALKEPIAIIGHDFSLVRANSKFQKQKKSLHCYESFAGRSAPCEGCPIGASTVQNINHQGPTQIQVGDKFYSVHSHGLSSSRFVHYYEDVTESRTLYARLIQTEKLGALGALAGQVAHELNNPLSGIKNLSQVIRSTLVSEDQIYKDLVEVEKAAARCQNIIHQLLEFSKEEGLEVIECNLDEIIEKTLPLLKTAMRTHRVIVDLQSRTSLMKVEPQLIQQVIFNLVHNACQAMAKAGQITIRTRAMGSFVEFHIEDTGPGIPEEIQPRLFEAFFTTKKVGTGTGLGLYLSQKIIERFKGNLDFTTSPQGTNFIGRLPVSRQI